MTAIAIDGPAVQISDDTPGTFQLWGTAAMSSTLTSSQSWTLQLLLGDESSQTTLGDKDQGGLAQTLGLSVGLTETRGWKLEAPVSTYCWARLVSSGNATLSLTDQRLVV